MNADDTAHGEPRRIAFPALRAALLRWSTALSQVMSDIWISHASDSESDIINPEVVDIQRKACFEVAEWRDVLDVIAKTPDLRRQIGHNVGTVLATWPLTATHIGLAFTTPMLVGAAAGDLTHYTLDEEMFDEIYGPIEAFLVSEELTITAISVFLGLDCESDLITLDDHVAITRIDQDDVPIFSIQTALFDVAYDQITPAFGESDIPAHYRNAMRYQVTLEKFIGEVDRAKAVQAYQSIEDARRACLRAIAATVSCYIIPWHTLVYEEGWRQSRARMKFGGARLIYRFDEPGARVSCADEDTLKRAWRHLTHANVESSNRFLRIALDRIAGLGSRVTAEDRLIDALIACESMFIDEGTSELRFRLAMNVASLSPHLSLGWPQATVFEFMKRAYDLRSKIVHGGEIGTKSLTFQSRRWEVWEFAQCAAGFVRATIGWLFAEYAPGEKFRLNWSKMYFPAPEVGDVDSDLSGNQR